MTFLTVFLFVAVFGVALCDVESASTTEDVLSSISLLECKELGGMDVNSLINEGAPCLNYGVTPGTRGEYHSAQDIEAFRRYFTSYCQRKAFVTGCLAEKMTKFERCHNETNSVSSFTLNAFKICRGLLDSVLDIGCRGDHNTLAAFSHRFKILQKNKETRQKVEMCFAISHGVVPLIESSSIDITSKIYVFYKEVNIFKECIQHIELEPQFKDVVNLLLGGIIERMQCISPTDETYVPCGNIDAALITSPTYCGIWTNNNELNMYDVLEMYTMNNFKFLHPYDEPSMIAYNNSDFEFLRRRYTRICDGKDFRITCADYPNATISCMNETEQHQFTILCETIDKASVGICLDEGSPLVDIMINVYNLKNKTPEKDDAIYECFAVVQSARKLIPTVDGNSSKNMRFYRELETFKECLLNKFPGFQIFSDAVIPIYNAIRPKMRCGHPEDNSTILCKDIIN